MVSSTHVRHDTPPPTADPLAPGGVPANRKERRRQAAMAKEAKVPTCACCRPS